MTTEKIHPWEARGFGLAPFRVIDCITLPSPELAARNPGGYQNAMAEASRDAQDHGVHTGTCDVCGTALTYNYVIESYDRKRFVVGSDCVAKTHSTTLTRAVEKIEKEAAIEESNRWLLDVLESTTYGMGYFVDSVIRDLKRKRVTDLPDRCVEILGQIYAKAVGGQTGSEAYQAALADFEAKIRLTQGS